MLYEKKGTGEMKDYILSVDLGTTSIKQALVTAEGTILASSSREYELLTPESSWVECSEDTYWEAFKSGLKEVLEKTGSTAENIRALGISAQGETFFCMGGDGRILRNAIVWMDNRAMEEADELRNVFSDELCYRKTGQVSFDPCWPASKLLWLRRKEPELFKKTKKFMLMEDWLIWRLTGRIVSEGSLLCSTVYWDINTKRYWPEMLAYLGIGEEQLPEILEPGTAAGTVTDSAAQETGLSVNTTVCTGALDQAAGAIGAGNIKEGIISENIGAALAICAPVKKPVFDPNQVMPLHYFGLPDMYMLHTFTTGGMALKWFRDTFCTEEKSVSRLTGINAYDLINSEADRIPEGCDGLRVLPHLSGSMAPDVNPKAKGVVYGFTLKHTKAHFGRAIMESIGFIVRRNIEALENMGLGFQEIRSLGGGSRSHVWNQIKADINQKELAIAGGDEAACLGAAVLAGTAVGIFSGAEDAVKRIAGVRRRYYPRSEKKEVYDMAYADYKQLFSGLDEVFETTYRGK
ncbi:hypothetical protein LQE92_14090 [Lacrimispora sp. NSJ-141]|uniref:Xylulokinase n=1 Tax=Lientehia hominis TaxID=2897778 RepID=A0AAP2W9U8_9FIRM|nr:FGGY family carbohydrate kinase [Lientehia hominis]MCD2493736.1 hypothetical protein [Lientehia hominis]